MFRAPMLVFLLAVAFIASAAAATEIDSRAIVPPDPALDRLVAEALANNPDVKAASESARAATFRIAPALALPDPTLSTNYQNDGTAYSLGKREMTNLAFMFSQPLPWPGKLELASRVAESEATEARLGSAARATLATEARVRRAYYDYALAVGERKLIDDRQKSWREIEAVARQRYAAGLGVQQDVLRAQVEILKLDEARADQDAIITAAAAELNRAVGRPQDAQSEVSAPGEPPALPPTTDLIAFAQARSPEVAASRQAIESASLRSDLAKKNLKPDFVVSGGPMYRGSMDPMWQVGLGVSLPIYRQSKQRNQIAEADARRSAATAESESVARELELRTRERVAAIEAAERVAKLYREGVIPVDQLSLESALASYQSGKVPFVSILDALNSLYSDRASYLERMTDSLRQRVAIAEASLDPTGMRGSSASRGTTFSLTNNSNSGAAAPATNAMGGMR